MLARNGFPPGVPCWIDLLQPDADATMAFYADLFGWTYQVRTPADAPFRYAYALLDGEIAAAVGTPPPGDAAPEGWTGYVWVESADATAAAVEANGGKILNPPADIPRAGRSALCADPDGAVFGLWQAAENRGIQATNVPGSWNFTILHTADPTGAERFYGAVFGWVRERFELPDGTEIGSYFRQPGYGDFLAAADPEIRERQAADQAPGGFADAVALLGPDEGAGNRWGATFAVADADAAVTRATELGATVVVPLFDTPYTREGVVRDPQGATLTLSEYRPPTG